MTRPTDTSAPWAPITQAATALFDAIDRLFLTIDTCRAQAARMAELQAMTDADLAGIGVTRKGIVAHVIRDRPRG